MKNKLQFCVLLAVASIPSVFAQPTIDGNYVIPEPQIWSFMKYGGGQPNLYTGTVSVSIPIYTYKDNDFSIPISLSYASNGYIPNVQANEVGLGWFLNAGGCVTREIRQSPDDYFDGYFLGYFYLKNTYINPDKIDSNPFNQLALDPFKIFPKPFYECKTDIGSYVESEPDIFHFNFLGHTGSFVYTGTEWYFFNTSDPYGTYKVNRVGGNEVVITSGDGYEYSFGGATICDQYGQRHMKYKDSTIPATGYQRCDIQGYFDTWLLTRIKAPNGRCVTFEYSGICQKMENIRHGGREVVHDFDVHLEWIAGGEHHTLDSYADIDEANIYQMWYMSYTVQLKKIIIEDVIDISFFHQEREYESGYFGKSTTPLYTLPKLDSIKVSSKFDNRLIKQCNLGYSYSRDDNKHNKIMFLTSLNISGEGEYTMKYHDLENHLFPCHGTVSIDHWGYYNGIENFNNVYYIPTTIITADFEEIITSTNRNPDSEYAKKGILEKITYPTGGYTTFEYESHEYSKSVTSDYTSENIPYLKDIRNIMNAGGVRVRKITDFDGQNKTSREYIYNDNNRSNGILLNMPRYSYRKKWMYDFNDIQKVVLDSRIVSTETLFSYCTDKTHVEYSSVIEKFDDGSFVKYNFANYQDFPDIYSLTDTIRFGAYIATLPRYANNFRRKPDYINSIRGKLLSTVYYNNAGDSLKGIYNTYDTTKQLGTILGVEKSEDSFYIHKTVIKPNPLESTSTIEYTQNGPIEKNEYYGYNRLGQLIHIEQTNSDGSVICDSTLYISNIISSEGSPEQTMLSLNMHNYPLSKVQTVQKALPNGGIGLERLSKATKYIYENLETRLPVMVAIQDAILTGVQSPGDSLSYNNQVYCTHFDAFGNVLQTIDKANVPTTYIWGYNGLYLVAKIVNCTLIDAANITGLFTLRLAPLNGGFPKEAQDRLYDTDTMKLYGFQATVYEYVPFWGISRLTDFSGKTICFEYDSFGRLKTVKDDAKMPVESYEYHNKFQ